MKTSSRQKLEEIAKAEAIRLTRIGRTIDAIKHLRGAFGCSLKEAWDMQKELTK